jgi:hypothetical protein
LEHKVRKEFLVLKIEFIILLDAISESNPRVIHEDRARKLSNELKRCTYYETCATYGLNVERVFHDGKQVFNQKFLFSLFLVCQKIAQQRYGFSTSTLSSNRSLTPQTISNITMNPSPVSNQVRMISNSHSVPSSSYVAGNINLAQTAPASVFSSYHYQQDQHQQPILVPPSQQSTNGVLKDRNNQQQIQMDKRTRSFKEPTGSKLSTLNEMQSFPGNEGQVRNT